MRLNGAKWYQNHLILSSLPWLRMVAPVAQQQRERNYIYNDKDPGFAPQHGETFESFLRIKRLLKVWQNNRDK